MELSKSKTAIAGEAENQFYKMYKLLQKEVEQWQQERGSYWLEALPWGKKPPYLPLMDLPEAAIIEVWQRLNLIAEVQIPDAELRKLWKQFRDGQIVMNPEMISRLQMSISGVAQLAGKKAKMRGVPALDRGYIASDDPTASSICPVCGEAATLAVLSQPHGHRTMYCTSCSFEWTVKRVGCLHCGSEDAKQQMYLKSEEFPGIEMAVCQVCGHYLKEIDSRMVSVQDYLWEEMRTLPLNFAAERWLAEQAKKNNQMH
jgi:FdhE protein